MNDVHTKCILFACGAVFGMALQMGRVHEFIFVCQQTQLKAFLMAKVAHHTTSSHAKPPHNHCLISHTHTPFVLLCCFALPSRHHHSSIPMLKSCLLRLLCRCCMLYCMSLDVCISRRYLGIDDLSHVPFWDILHAYVCVKRERQLDDQTIENDACYHRRMCHHRNGDRSCGKLSRYGICSTRCWLVNRLDGLCWIIDRYCLVCCP